MHRSLSLTDVKTTLKEDKSKISEHLFVDCSICQDILLFPCTLSCGHNFCYKCLKQMYNYNNNRLPNYDSDSDSDQDSDSDSDSGDAHKNRDTSTYRKSFYDNQCFESVLSGKAGNKFSSDLMMDKDKLLSHILNDSIFEENCRSFQCPTCRQQINIIPKPNILLHESLKQILGDVYEQRMLDYLSTFCEDFIIEEYEKSERYKTIKMLVEESIQSIQQAVSFNDLMASFSAYSPIEIVWCLYKSIQNRTFVIVNDLIISYNHYSTDFEKLLRDDRVSNRDINFLIVSHPKFSLTAPQLEDTLKKQFRGKKTGELSLMDDETALTEAMRQCVTANNLLNW